MAVLLKSHNSDEKVTPIYMRYELMKDEYTHRLPGELVKNHLARSIEGMRAAGATDGDIARVFFALCEFYDEREDRKQLVPSK